VTLSRADIASYREQGYLLVENAVSADQLAALRKTTDGLIDASRAITKSNDQYDLDEGHSVENPRLTRIKLPHKLDPIYWEVLVNSRIIEVLTDLLGADVALQTAKLNIKAPGGGMAVEWHQDWAFYPHTNDDLLAVGLMLDDVDADNGPLQVIPGSHRGPVLDHSNRDGVFCGAVDPDDPDFHLEDAVTFTGRAGSATVHHVRMLHGSAPNRSQRSRMILFYECLAADAWPLVGADNYIHRQGPSAVWEDLSERMICGEPSLQPRIESNPVRIPLPLSPESGSIFKVQKSGGAHSAFE